MMCHVEDRGLNESVVLPTCPVTDGRLPLTFPWILSNSFGIYKAAAGLEANKLGDGGKSGRGR